MVRQLFPKYDPLGQCQARSRIGQTRVDAIAAAVRTETGQSFNYRLGVMVETPRAALRADEIALEFQIPEFWN